MYEIGDKVRVTPQYGESASGHGNLVGREGTIIRIDDAGADSGWPYTVDFGDGMEIVFDADEIEPVNTVLVELHGKFFEPVYATAGAAGADLRSTESFTIPPGGRWVASTGVRLAMPPHLYGKIEDRSGWAASKGLTTLAGVIDPDFRGEIKVVLLNTGTLPIRVDVGERIAQIVFQPFVKVKFSEVDELPYTERGEGGFGHTGT